MHWGQSGGHPVGAESWLRGAESHRGVQTATVVLEAGSPGERDGKAR